MKTIRFGIIGCGLMGREFASAAARWCHLTDMDVRPEIVAACDMNPGLFDWFRGHFSTVKLYTSDYHELLASPDVDAIYCAVPHNLHEQIYCDIIRAGKHLFGEKPFGIDKAANDAIMACIAEHPNAFVRCCSEFPFYPAMQRMGDLIESGFFGRLIEVNAGFLHSSDLNPDKPINWKRMIQFNGAYGVMGDLGMHVCHVPFRAGWIPQNVRAVLSNLIPERPDGKGGRVPCETWDNATLLCEATDPAGGTFPLTLKTQRIAPGEMNTWYLEVKGLEGCARFSTACPTRIEVMKYENERQDWTHVLPGYASAFKAITGGIFEFGFTDAILQMWAAYLYELVHGKPVKKFAGVATPEEAALSHRLFTAALESQKMASAVAL